MVSKVEKEFLREALEPQTIRICPCVWTFNPAPGINSLMRVRKGQPNMVALDLCPTMVVFSCVLCPFFKKKYMHESKLVLVANTAVGIESQVAIEKY